MITRSELFDETDLEAALARFDELSRPAPQLENTASKAHARFLTYLAARDWDAMAATMTDDIVADDRRHVVNAGIRHGREAALADARAIADLGYMTMTQTAIATRGEHLILTRFRAFATDPESVQFEVLHLVEIDGDGRIKAFVGFDPDDIDAAFAELDARYLAGEAAPHAHTWSVVASNVEAFNRHELPAWTSDWVNIDHRKVTAFALGDRAAYIRATWDDARPEDVRRVGASTERPWRGDRLCGTWNLARGVRCRMAGDQSRRSTAI